MGWPIVFVLLMINVVLCVAIAGYAEKKGKSWAAYFLLSALLSPVFGFLFAWAADDRPEGAGKKRCPDCAEWVRSEALKCRHCGSDLSIAAEPAAVQGGVGRMLG
jgi:sugar phosphate permease